MATIPDTFPSEWIKHSDVVVQEGCYPTCTVIRPWNKFTPIVVHTAIFFENGEIGYERGTYCRTLEEAEKAFKARVDDLGIWG